VIATASNAAEKHLASEFQLDRMPGYGIRILIACRSKAKLMRTAGRKQVSVLRVGEETVREPMSRCSIQGGELHRGFRHSGGVWRFWNKKCACGNEKGGSIRRAIVKAKPETRHDVQILGLQPQHSRMSIREHKVRKSIGFVCTYATLYKSRDIHLLQASYSCSGEQ
jgi:hypothetical protein